MHLGIRALLDFYRRHNQDDALVLVTIIATEGSTYRKPGAMMLISPEGEYEGMISGGCLEGDLLQHADAVFASGEAAFVTYDMHADDDLVWSLGLGCDGVIHLMLQRLGREDDFGFLRQLEASRAARKAALLALVTRPESGLPCGSFALLDQAGAVTGAPQLLHRLEAHTRPWPSWRTYPARLDPAADQADVLQINIPAATRIMICGAGPDAVPLARALAELDWDIVVVDHRPAFAKAGRFPPSCTVLRSRPERLGETADLSELDGVVIMSHHLDNDGEYLRQVSAYEIGYIGVLGPRARRDRLREMAACSDLEIHGPAGLDIGAELPSGIALSIAAEIHAVLNRRNGLSLTARVDEES
ncbi:MAG: XdhC family protein [Xanthomonadales bacterium]|nr:XdhC family protein [Gammaproteobacteria bacterium]NND58539.1 XdhC family protein [Xanthomonadales bacterium]NNK52233.1 XdhC family protein [Xanthomonadales bacterium]